ncbi:unnamed protein product [Cuscuta campestris]|uniref:Uncharacterized protein n=1 Tax=Cuscuta campestris TaxID=132261 RepID=A0A484N7N9_9ASTE|nr:unnamed protein product [Cuscuta campestris]
MPSGAKKRKAAKKKKGLQVKGAPQSTQLHSHAMSGEEDLEHTYDKDSDGGDASSPTSQEYHNCNDLIDQEEEEADKQEGDGSCDQPSTSHESKSEEMTNGGGGLEKVTTEQKSDLNAERNLKAEDEFQSMDIGIEVFETPKESHDGSLLRSFSSCSKSNLKDGPNVFNKDNIVVNDTPVVDLVKEVDLLFAGKGMGEVAVFTTDLDKAATSENVEVEKSDGLGLMENGDENMGVVDNSGSLSEALVTMEKEDELVQTSSQQDDAKTLTDFSTEVNLEEVTPSADVPEVHDSMEVGRKEDEVFGTSNVNEARISEPEDSSRISEPEDSATQEEGDTLTLSYSAPKIEASVEADPLTDSKLSESADSQHQNGLAIRPVQTSWKGCCGLFELFKGSNR